jgi:hypothetical protein
MWVQLVGFNIPHDDQPSGGTSQCHFGGTGLSPGIGENTQTPRHLPRCSSGFGCIIPAHFQDAVLGGAILGLATHQTNNLLASFVRCFALSVNGKLR